MFYISIEFWEAFTALKMLWNVLCSLVYAFKMPFIQLFLLKVHTCDEACSMFVLVNCVQLLHSVWLTNRWNIILSVPPLHWNMCYDQFISMAYFRHKECGETLTFSPFSYYIYYSITIFFSHIFYERIQYKFIPEYVAEVDRLNDVRQQTKSVHAKIAIYSQLHQSRVSHSIKCKLVQIFHPCGALDEYIWAVENLLKKCTILIKKKTL